MGLEAYGKWLLDAVKRGILRYGQGPERLDRIKQAYPGMQFIDEAGSGRSPPSTLMRLNTSSRGPAEVRMDLYDTIHDLPEHDTTPGAYEYAKYGTGRNTKFGIAHMLGAEKGAGVSNAAYPAFGELAVKDGRLIVPDYYVTMDNVPNRSIKGASMDLAHGKPVMVPAESQLRDTGYTVDKYMGLPSEQRAALLFKAGQDNNERQLAEKINDTQYSGGLSQRMYDKIMDALGIDPSKGKEGISKLFTPGVSVDNINEMVKILRKAGTPDIGVDTLRRGQAIRYMEDGSQAPDEIIKGLLFCEGGLAKASHAMRHVP